MAANRTMVALLRGINVGKAKRIAMADLRELFGGLGYTDVRTHLVSGNVVFGCPASQAAGAATKIEKAIADQLGVSCAVIVRTGAQLLKAVRDNPLAEDGRDPAKLLVGFLGGKPDEDGVARLPDHDTEDGEIRFGEGVVYLWCPRGVLDSPFSSVNWDRELKVKVTMRNWNTARKLAELVEAAG